MKFSDIFSGMVGNMTFSMAVLQEAVEAKANKMKEEAVAAAIDLLDNFQQQLDCNVKHLQQIRKAERKQSEMVKKVQRALDYFGETGNPLPVFRAIDDNWGGQSFCERLGVEVPNCKDPIWEVPADWTPTTFWESVSRSS